MTAVRPLPIPAGERAREALPALRAALDGSGPAVLPCAADGPLPELPDGAVPDDGTALVVGTSGSTGTPKLAMLPATALGASADATHDRLGGPGTWLLAMPPHHIAGVQVMLRCVAAGTEPHFVDLSGGFTPDALARAVARMTPAADPTPGGPSMGPATARRYTALVPTQLVRVLADPGATAALADLDAVLVGGAGTPPSVLSAARAEGIRVVTTYGMSETCGGCVYDGEPLRGALVRTDAEGRLSLGGATLATGYLGRPDLTAAAFSTDADGTRWFRTDDVGHRDGVGRWHVDGRLDDLVNTGGLKVAPRVVEDALTEVVPGVAEAVVVGLPDAEWGQVVAAALVLSPGADPPTLTGARDALRGTLPAHALPRHLLVLGALPLRGPGKPDRLAVTNLLEADRAARATMEA
ncbi:o-succinylbenzoate--CoA ligase [Phycicoccus sp. M110.8]|uniref:o-succinylbenzoate--CoA ligase n=1 Tax=Phycicoccus sp. M110.8 TaxID=3075433 RepID=UPI0028FDA58D|nr:o-succinylbenzoate--CoA ligase [Phycicoccus sp. M110.8]MDU0314276.1 o-succinylbenzoate--CoA ligase [Phycicoccus sp. M110.8]